jgi:Flp pilus assembly protein TadD
VKSESPVPAAFLVAACLLLVASSAAQAADEATVLRIRASQLAAEGDCSGALGHLDRARAFATDDARSALLTGQCLIEGQHYGEALPYLHEANRLDSDSGEVALLLGVTAYRIGDLETANRALARAEDLLPENAEVALYRGLVLLAESRSDEASERFDRASRISPTAVEPMASYYGGLAHRHAGRSAEADASLRRVGELAPGSEWAVQAQAALDAPPSKRFELRRWTVIQAGLDYDSNVALIADGIPVPNSIQDRSDGRGVWSLEAGAELYRDEDWGVGVLADYFGAAYFEETEFNQHYIGGGFFVDRSLAETSVLRVQPIVGFSWFDKDEFMRFYGARTELLQSWGDAGDGTFYARYSYDDFRYDVLGATSELRKARNRDGHSLLAGYDHALLLGSSTLLELGPFGRYYHSKGTEYDMWGLGLWMGVRQELPLDFSAQVNGSYAYDNYANVSTFLQPGEKRTERRDHIGTVSTEVERPLTQWLSVTARWHYFNSASNTDVYDYDRHVVGAFFTVALGD